MRSCPAFPRQRARRTTPRLNAVTRQGCAYKGRPLLEKFWLEQSLSTIHRANWYRSLQTIQGHPGPEVLLEGREVINFASNDYLRLAGDARLIQAAVAATKEFGTGSTGPRLLSGHRELHRQLELAISPLKQTEDALVFSSGNLANLGALTTLVQKVKKTKMKLKHLGCFREFCS